MFIAVVLMQGCVGVHPYQTTAANDQNIDGQQPPVSVTEKVQDCANTPCLLFAEYDGFGRMFNRNQLTQIVRYANDVAASDGLVIVFVHGWHHNARSDDSNLAHFKTLLENAQAIQGKGKKVLGVFVGWPGESVTVEPFSTLSFWERKNTAHSVGNGEVFELFLNLSLARRNYPDSRLAIIGHSFGGAVTYTAISHELTRQIVADPITTDSSQLKAPSWDLAVLVNPAFEAMRLRSQINIAKSRNYRRDQLPHLVIVTSDADAATRAAFKAGRFVSTFFDRYAEDDIDGAELNTTAVGHYFPYITHQLAKANITRCPVKTFDANALDNVTDKKELLTDQRNSACFDDPRLLSTLKNAQPVELVRCDSEKDCIAVAPGHALRKGDAETGAIPLNMPIMNIRTTSDVMTSHTDIWNDTMHSFLTQLVVLMIKDPTAVPSINLPAK